MGDMVRARLLNLDVHGDPHRAGVVVQAEDQSYIVEADGSFRRVQIVEQQKDGVLYRRIRAATKSEKKALKRERAKARSEVIAGALRQARTLEVSHA